MDPIEVEFIGEDTTVGVIPNFSFEPIHLISGTIGPFRAGLCTCCFTSVTIACNNCLFTVCIGVHVPLWLAIHLRKQQKCRIVPPEWMDMEILEDIKEDEKRSRLVEFSTS